MPLRNSLSDYRYAYQGQEKDPETGKEAFELRLWDARIGRWLTTDPYGQYHSPYLGMGNNPINGIDPDGGFFGAITLGSTLVGAVVGGAVSLATGGDDFWASVASGAVDGAFVGLAIETGGASAAVLGGIAGGFIGSGVYQRIQNGGKINTNKALFQGTLGGVTAGLGPIIGRGLSKVFRRGKIQTGPLIEMQQGQTIDDAVIDQINTIAREKGILSIQNGLRSHETVDFIVDQMHNGLSKKGFLDKIGAFRFDGKIVINEGNHATTAAIKFFIETGDDTFINSILKASPNKIRTRTNSGARTFDFNSGL